MDERTVNYLEGRFRDYYRSADVKTPPNADAREWGYIPWDPSPDTRMIRHKSLEGIGHLGNWLGYTQPRHVYFSASLYDDPGASTMDSKDWQGSNLVFDIDADHLPGIDEETVEYGEMLAAGKEHVINLLEFVEEDFGFEDVEVVFSGGRGYHVHIRDESVRSLGSEARREFVDYVTGRDVDLDTVTDRSVDTLSQESKGRTINPGGGWSARVHAHIMDRLEDMAEYSEDELAASEDVPGVGEKKAEAVKTHLDNLDDLHLGYMPPSGMTRLLRELVDEAVREMASAVDEPVTTDINRLIRVPGSLHGGSALKVCSIDRDEIEDFDPLVDAVPEVYTTQEIKIELENDRTVNLAGETYEVPAGEAVVPEYVGMFLMARGEATKLPE